MPSVPTPSAGWGWEETRKLAATGSCRGTQDFGSTQQNVSKHLGILLHAGIVDRRKAGNYTYYWIVDEGVFALCDNVCASLAAQLESLRELIAGAPR